MAEPEVRRTSNDEAVRRIWLWLDLYDTTEKLLLAGLRRKIGPDGDLKAAYREWYDEKMRDHDAAIFRIAEGLARAKQGENRAG
jgi:hypothetical protein